jgi:hypothetical protein
VSTPLCSPLHAIEQFKAFARLRRDGRTIADIAAHFGTGSMPNRMISAAASALWLSSKPARL